MKKILTILTIMLMTFSLAFAAIKDTGDTNLRTDKGMENLDVEVQGSSPDMENQGNYVQIDETDVQTNQQNQGEDSQIQNQVQNQVQTQNRIQDGEYKTEGGKQMTIQSQAGERMQFQVGEHKADTGMQLMQQTNAQGETQLRVKLSNGKNSEVKIMPDAASQTALERLQVKNCNETNGCQIELKEVGSGNQTRAAYEVQVKKQSKILGLFKKEMQVQAQVDAENGEVIKSQKPWWAFMASESKE